MSGWGGAHVQDETNAVADRVAETHDLTPAQRSVVADLVHTLTYHGTYSHAELPAMFDALLRRS